jgi:hypothetical protein
MNTLYKYCYQDMQILRSVDPVSTLSSKRRFFVNVMELRVVCLKHLPEVDVEVEANSWL